ncbi:MAG: acetate--CoA ligase family protein [Acidobacteria bacterium]|nr:acetate--CoA ligase family protein [Acidobacteriota bacterium]MBE3124142.1 acetate--CoA ligase family protein [Acidobacteriota bacterium]MBE3130454.1 acetate--CoA ligase family protein [Acidobacteriota bacterium]
MPSNNERSSSLLGLDELLRPRSLAVIGASDTPGKVGYTVLRNIVASGYKGPVYPINPKDPEVQGLKAYRSVLDVPGDVDAAVIVVPARLCVEVADECGRKGVKGLIIISSGFSEVGRKDLEDEVVRAAGKYGTRVLGPNIVGVLSNSDHMNASFAPFLPFPGKVSMVSQSGALVVAIDAATYVRNVGFDKLISIGNMADVDIADCVEWLDADPNTTCISLYIEGLKDGRRLIEAGLRATKPIVALKAGVSAHGAAAAASHTGSLAGAAAVYEAAFEQAGIVQAADLNNLFDRSLALSLQPPMRGENLLVLTNGGGVGVLATDSAERVGLPLKFAPADLQAELRKSMPEFGSAKNPVDLTGMAGADWYYGSVKACLTHPWVDGLVILYCETSLTVPMEIAGTIHRAIVDSGVKDKPVTIAFIGGEQSAKAMKGLMENGLPAYDVPDKAVNAMAALNEYAHIRTLARDESPADDLGAAEAAAREIIRSARAYGRLSLTEIEAKQVFAAYGLPVTKTALARWEDEAVALAAGMGFPVVLKVVSPDILHKSDAGGVKVNIRDETGVRDAFRIIMKNARAFKADADILGIAVQEMAPAGLEVILGSINDSSFGPTMMFGLGGILVELLRHVTFRVAPVNRVLAKIMLEKIHAARITEGLRGEAPRDREALAGVIERYSRMVADLGDEVAESDANPTLLYEVGKGVKIVDARIILKKTSG